MSNQCRSSVHVGVHADGGGQRRELTGPNSHVTSCYYIASHMTQGVEAVILAPLKIIVPPSYLMEADINKIYWYTYK